MVKISSNLQGCGHYLGLIAPAIVIPASTLSLTSGHSHVPLIKFVYLLNIFCMLAMLQLSFVRLKKARLLKQVDWDWEGSALYFTFRDRQVTLPLESIRYISYRMGMVKVVGTTDAGESFCTTFHSIQHASIRQLKWMIQDARKAKLLSEST